MCVFDDACVLLCVSAYICENAWPTAIAQVDQVVYRTYRMSRYDDPYAVVMCGFLFDFTKYWCRTQHTPFNRESSYSIYTFTATYPFTALFTRNTTRYGEDIIVHVILLCSQTIQRCIELFAQANCEVLYIEYTHIVRIFSVLL